MITLPVKRKIRYVNRLYQVPQLSPDQRKRLERVTKLHAFRSNDYYLNLIDWSNPNDPIRRLIIPNPGELIDDGLLDPSN